MVATLMLIGFGLIVALGGAILLDRERFNSRPRAAYRMATVVGAVAVVAGVLL